ncbi:MAG: AAA family ATPase, partial [Propionibacteriaceae bacterium]|nr:AAA family ATPase [Propionibacteriaceae bacterium]
MINNDQTNKPNTNINIKQDILNIYTMISPTLLIYFKNSDLYLFISMIPVIINISMILVNIYINFLNKNTDIDDINFYKSRIILSEKNIPSDGHPTNNDFIAFMWWINLNKKLLNINNLQINNYYSDKIRDNLLSFYGYHKLSPDTIHKFIYNNEKYLVSIKIDGSEYDKRSTLYLQSNTYVNCKKLLKYIVCEYYKYINKKLVKKEIFYNDFNGTNLNCIPIGIKKNKQNTFIEKNIDIFNKIDIFLKPTTKEKNNLYGKPNKLTFLLSGITGSGKTSIIYAISNIYKINIYELNLNNMLDDKELKIKLSTISNNIKSRNNAIILFEEIDGCKCVQKRNTLEDNNNNNNNNNLLNKLTLTDILPIFDGYNYFDNCIIFITTNHPEKLDSAFLRPGRIDYHYKFDYCSLDLIQQIIKFYLNELM